MLAGKGILKCGEGNAQATLVSYVFSESGSAVGHQSRLYLHLIELLHEPCSLCLECLGISLGPPIVHIPVFVEKASLVVETVGHLVRNHHSDGSVIHSVISIGIIERRLQYACREADFVGGRIVIGIDGLRTHSPLAPVHRLAQFGQIVGHIPAGSGNTVLIIAQLRVDFQAGIVLPLVRISYLYDEGGQFLLSFGLGLFAHPVQSGHPLAQSLLDV